MSKIYEMNVRPLSQELQTKAEKEINEVPSRVQEDVEHIREWILQQPHLNARTDDQWVLNFLRGCKFNLQKTKMKLDKFYSIRCALPEFYSNRDPYLPELQEILALGLVLPLSRSNNCDDPCIFLHRCKGADPSKLSIADLIKVSLMIMDIAVNEDDQAVISGQHLIMDLSGVNINHILQFAPSITKKAVVCIRDAYPSRFKGIYVMHLPSIFESVVNIVKPLFGEKLSNRMKIYSESNVQTMHDVLPLSVLPQNYGGNGDSLQELTAKWKAKVESYREWFLEDEKYCTEESKRIENTSTLSEIFGMEGSFRKLNVD